MVAFLEHATTIIGALKTISHRYWSHKSQTALQNSLGGQGESFYWFFCASPPPEGHRSLDHKMQLISISNTPCILFVLHLAHRSMS